MAPCLSLVLCFLLTMTQGVSGQKWNVSMTYKDICALTGSSVIMLCSFTHPPGLRVTKVYWGINPIKGIPLDDLLDNPQYAGRVQYSTDVKKNCTLTLSDVRGTDTAEYYARIETNEGAQKWQSVPVLLEVEDAPKNTSVAVSPLGDLVEGTSVNLTCSSDAKPPVQSYTWYKGSELVTSKTTTQQVYSISNVRSEHTGYYYCQAKNKHGHSNSTLIHLNILYPPKGTSAALYHAADLTEGSSISLVCSSDSNPPVENYTWYRKTAGETTAIDSGETIKFTLTSTTAGLYHCEATNRIGFQHSPFLEVSLAGFRWQTAALSVSLALVVSVTTLLGLGLLCWRKSRIASNDSGNTNNNAQNYENNHHQGENLYSIQMSSVYSVLNPDTIDTDAVYHTIQVK